ncbi:MAG TPA: hypothetical protein VIN04_14335 [Myxococcota bacterium]
MHRPAESEVRIEEAGPHELAAALDVLLDAEPELAYANFAPIAARPGAAQALHRRRWLAREEHVATLLARDGDGRPLAALRLEERPFESEHFGLRMARVERPLGMRDPALRLAALRPLYRAAFARLAELGFAHVAARASTRDRAAPWAIQEAGAFHVDTQVSWMCPLTGAPHDEQLPGRLRLEVHERESVCAVPRAAWKRLTEWAGIAFDRGPLVFDWTLDPRRAADVYRVWTERVMTGRWADVVLLVREDDEVVAFISMLHMPDVSEAAGTVVHGRGLGATLPDYRGLFTAIQREMIARQPAGARFMENETQVATIGSINVYAKLGFRYLRSTATFHRRLDGGRACA